MWFFLLFLFLFKNVGMDLRFPHLVFRFRFHDAKTKSLFKVFETVQEACHRWRCAPCARWGRKNYSGTNLDTEISLCSCLLIINPSFPSKLFILSLEIHCFFVSLLSELTYGHAVFGWYHVRRVRKVLYTDKNNSFCIHFQMFWHWLFVIFLVSFQGLICRCIKIISVDISRADLSIYQTEGLLQNLGFVIFWSNK